MLPSYPAQLGERFDRSGQRIDAVRELGKSGGQEQIGRLLARQVVHDPLESLVRGVAISRTDRVEKSVGRFFFGSDRRIVEIRQTKRTARLHLAPEHHEQPRHERARLAALRLELRVFDELPDRLDRPRNGGRPHFRADRASRGNRQRSHEAIEAVSADGGRDFLVGRHARLFHESDRGLELA